MKLTTQLGLLAFGLFAIGAVGCAPSESAEEVEANESNLGAIAQIPSLFNASKWFRWLGATYPSWMRESFPSSAHSSAWPEHLEDGEPLVPTNAAVFAHNEIFIEGVTPPQVFALMTRPDGYKAFYPNSGDPSTSRLSSVGQRYTWATFGVAQDNTVLELEDSADEGRITWLAKSLGTRALHRWIFLREGSGTRVITEECQAGKVAELPELFSKMKSALPASHELWLQGLRCQLVDPTWSSSTCQALEQQRRSAPDADP